MTDSPDNADSDDGEREEIVVPVPTAYDDNEAAAFRAGVRTCAQLFGQAAETFYHATDADDTSDDTDDTPTDACDDCGAALIDALGGPVCPECGL